jgi:hypothetical protein
MCDHFVDTSIKTIKYLNDLHDGWMGQKIHYFIQSQRDKKLV